MYWSSYITGIIAMSLFTGRFYLDRSFQDGESSTWKRNPGLAGCPARAVIILLAWFIVILLVGGMIHFSVA